MTRPPIMNIGLRSIPPDEKARHDALVDIFGRYLMWMREFVLKDKRALVEAPKIREHLGTLFREVFDRMAGLPSSDREVAYGFARECIDGFARELLRLLANSGFDLRLDDTNVVRFRLVMEICDGNSGNVILEEIINRGGRHFPDYWGRWLNRYQAQPQPAEES